MKILFLAHLFPLPLDSGGKIKTYHTLQALARKHEVHLLAYVRLDEELHMLEPLQKMCASVQLVRLKRGKIRQASDLLMSLVLGESFIITRDNRREMQDAFDSMVASVKPDVVHVDHLQMAQFVRQNGSYKIILDNHNVEYAIIRRTAETDESSAKRLYASIEWPKLQRYELKACEDSDIVLTVSDEDGNTLRKMNSLLTNLCTVPIGVDIDYFQPVERKPESQNILFTGTMYWPPNIDCVLYFHREILPIIRKTHPDCTFTVAGQRPAPSVQALAQDPAVRITGYVDDIREVSRDCSAFIVPLRSGSGVRVKILNAFAMGLPVVSTTLGAEGLDVRDGEHLLIADSAEDFAKAVSKVIDDPELAGMLAQNGRKLVCERYSWEVVGDQLLSIYEHEIGQ